MLTSNLPIAIIGAGPVGLAAAAELIARRIPVKLYEAGDQVGAFVRDWQHVHLFSPWEFNIAPAARALLEQHGWQEPKASAYPTGGELVRDYLDPLAATPEIATVLETGARVTAIGRYGMDKVVTKDRAERPFILIVKGKDGETRRDLARAVIDASGTWATPNPLGAGGIQVDGEIAFASAITYGIPDVLGRDRAQFAGRKILVVGAGHSAANVLLDLAELAESEPQTKLLWATRGSDLSRIYGGGAADKLAARGELGTKIKALVESGRLTLTTGFAVTALRADKQRIFIDGETTTGLHTLGPVDRIVVATGQRPDLTLTRELRLDLDPWLESTKALGPMIDPNLHSCGSVPPHGHRELTHPESGFYTVGIKSYGRAPTFLMMTGYEQVRSVVAALAGDLASADAVQLVLPETGVCSTDRKAIAVSSGCCGRPAPKEAEACCVGDAVAKETTGKGCGCGSTAKSDAVIEPA